MIKKVNEEKIIDVIKKFKDVRFIHNGRSIENGTDCLGFMILFYREFGIDIPNDDGKFIEEDWYKSDPERYIRNIKALGWQKVSIYELKPLDMVYFAISRNIISHTGIMINNRKFVHMSPKSNFLISKLERHWVTRYRGAYRYPYK